MSRTRKIYLTDLGLFKDGRSRSAFRRSAVGDVLKIEGVGTSISVLVCEMNDNSRIECPCAFDSYSALCANACCNRYAYKNLDSIMENL